MEEEKVRQMSRLLFGCRIDYNGLCFFVRECYPLIVIQFSGIVRGMVIGYFRTFVFLQLSISCICAFRIQHTVQHTAYNRRYMHMYIAICQTSCRVV